MIDSIIKAVVATFTMGSQKPLKVSGGMKSYSHLMVVALLLQSFNYQQSTSPVVMADQPVHCLRGQLYGVWNFHVSK